MLLAARKSRIDLNKFAKFLEEFLKRFRFSTLKGFRKSESNRATERVAFRFSESFRNFDIVSLRNF